MTGPLDPELKALFADHPELLRIAEGLAEGADRPATLDPNFRGHLRRQLMAEAKRVLPPRPSFWSRLVALGRGPQLTLAGAGVLAVAVLASGVLVYAQRQSTITAKSPIQDASNVALTRTIEVSFSGPVNHAAVERSLQITPATAVASTRWDGGTLIITPQNPLAESTAYTVTIKPPPAPPPVIPVIPPNVIPTKVEPVVIKFVTATPPQKPAPPVYAVEQLTFGLPVRLSANAEAGMWAPGGQEVLFTREAAPTVAPSARAPASASPSAGATPSASPSPPVQTAPAPSASPRAPSEVRLTSAWSVAAGAGRERLLLNAVLPRWSPSGTALAFWRMTPEGAQLAVAPRTANAQGMGAGEVLAESGDASIAPVWLGDDRLAFVDSGQVKVVRIGTKDAQTLTAPAVRPLGELTVSPDGRYLAVPAGDSLHILDLQQKRKSLALPGAEAVAWSVDGSRLAYVDTIGEASATPAPTPAGSPRATPTASASPSATASASATPGPTPSATPSPTSVAPPPAIHRLWVGRADASSARVTYTSTGSETLSSPSWSPDARALVFARGQRAWVINADGSSPRPVGESEALRPAWSPTGDRLLFGRSDEDGKATLWVQPVGAQGLSLEARASMAAAESVDRFMKARLNRNAAEARGLLTDAAATTFAADDALLGGRNPRFGRFYVISAQPAGNTFDFRVRTVLVRDKGTEVSYFEEALKLEKRGADYRIVAADTFPLTKISGGPSVVMVSQRALGTGRSILVLFDSDLDSTSVNDQAIYLQSAVGVRVTGTDVVFSPGDHGVRLTVPRSLPPGDYVVTVTSQVRDVKGKELAQEYAWPFTVRPEG